MTLSEFLDTKGITQAAFARRIGVSEPSLSRMLNGLQRPNLTTLQAIERETSGAVLPSDFPAEAASPAHQAAQ